MHKLSIILSSIAIVVVVLSVSGIISSSPKIAYVETNKLLANYKGMQIAGAQYQEKLTLWNANIDTLRSELQKEIDEYERNKNSLSEKEKDLSEKLIQTKQNQLLEYRKSIEEKAAEEDRVGTQKVLAEVNEFVQKYGKDNGFTIIIGANESGNLVYSEEHLNITDDILIKLNQKYGSEF